MIQRVRQWLKQGNNKSKILSGLAIGLVLFSFVIVGVLGTSFAASVNLPENLKTNTLYSDDGYRVNLFPGLAGDDIISLTPFVATDSGTTYHMYCLERTKDWYNDTIITKAEKLDSGYAYIMMNGYPEKTLTNEGEWVDSYLTQVALWLYQDRSSGVADTSSGSLTINQKKAIVASKYYSIINDLVTNAIKAKNTYTNVKPNFVVSSSNFHLDSSLSYLETDFINVSANVPFSSYQVASDMKYVEILNEQGDVLAPGTKILSGKKFKIRLPLEHLSSSDLSIQISVTMDYSEYEAYQYRPTSHADTMQLSIVAAVQETLKQAVASVNFTIPTGSLTIEKIDGDTNQLLPGAKIEVYREVGSQKSLVTSFDSTTNATMIEHLLPGKYTVVEKSAPRGYLIQSDSQSVVLNPSTDLDTTVRLINTPISVKIQKVDGDTNQPIAGAVIKVIDATGEEVFRFTSTTGYTQIPNLAIGDYQAIEVSAPNGYYLNSDPYRFSITEDTTELSVTMKDQKNQVEILKIDEDSGDFLPGATLRIVNVDSNTVIATWVTTEDAKIFEGLAPGNYQVEELSAPVGYATQTNVIPFTISDVQTKKLTIKFSNTKNQIMISKVDEEGRLLAGASIAIYDSTGQEVQKFTSEKTPTIIKKLTPGRYIAKEIKAPDGYQLNSTPVYFDVVEDTKNLSVTLKNIKKRLYFGKIDSITGDYVSGAKLQLLDSNDKIVATWTSSNDLYEITGISNGTYYLEEVSAPLGYIASSERVKVVVDNSTTTATYTLKNEKIAVKIGKVDQDSKQFIPGATLELLNSNYEVIDTWVTNENYRLFDDLKEGVYYVKETSAPLGYVLNTAMKSFTLDKDHATVTVNFENEKTTVKLGKVDASDGSYIPGATLRLSRLDGNMDSVTFTSEDQATVFRGLAKGTYILEEISAPLGYVSSNSKITFEVDERGKTKNVSLKSEYISIYVKDRLLHIDTNATEGYQFQLFTADHKLVDTYSIGTKEFVSETLENGMYLLKQTKVPKGVVLNSTPYIFTVSDTGLSDVVFFTNDYTKVEFGKREMIGGKQLSGGHFILRNEKGVVVQEWDSTDSIQRINRLTPGIYTLSEVKAPSGYQLSQSQLTFTVEETSDIQTVTMFNTLVVDVPDTARNSLFYWFFGTIILLSGFSIIGYVYVKRQG